MVQDSQNQWLEWKHEREGGGGGVVVLSDGAGGASQSSDEMHSSPQHEETGTHTASHFVSQLKCSMEMNSRNPQNTGFLHIFHLNILNPFLTFPHSSF